MIPFSSTVPESWSAMSDFHSFGAAIAVRREATEKNRAFETKLFDLGWMAVSKKDGSTLKSSEAVVKKRRK